LESWKCSCGIRCADHMSTQYSLVQRRLLSRPRFVRACSATDLFSWLGIGFGSGQKTVKLKKIYSSDWIFCPKWKHWLPLYMEIKIILLGAFWSIIKTDLEKVKHKNYINYDIKRWIYFGNYCYSVWKLLLAKVYKRLMLPVVLNAFKMYSVTLREENYKFWIVLVIIQFKNNITHMIYKTPDIKIQILSSCRLGFVVGQVALGHIFLRVIQFPCQYHSTRVPYTYHLWHEQQACWWPKFRDIVSPHRLEQNKNIHIVHVIIILLVNLCACQMWFCILRE
jgi:hypothetical protein